MDAIKKKMQAMKLEKDSALDRALQCEQQAKDANLRAEKVTNILLEKFIQFHLHYSLFFGLKYEYFSGNSRILSIQISKFHFQIN